MASLAFSLLGLVFGPKPPLQIDPGQPEPLWMSRVVFFHNVDRHPRTSGNTQAPSLTQTVICLFNSGHVNTENEAQVSLICFLFCLSNKFNLIRRVPIILPRRDFKSVFFLNSAFIYLICIYV